MGVGLNLHKDKRFNKRMRGSINMEVPFRRKKVTGSFMATQNKISVHNRTITGQYRTASPCHPLLYAN
jgi:hypothetical protein